MPNYMSIRVMFAISGCMLLATFANVGTAEAQNQHSQIHRAVREAVVGSQVLAQGELHLGKRLGDGECTTFVSQMLARAGARPADFSSYRRYVWGRPLARGEAIRPGDIIQFDECRFEWRTANAWGNHDMDHHTAIIAKANGTRLTLLHQNAPIGGPVSKLDLDLAWKTKGYYVIYRPTPGEYR